MPKPLLEIQDLDVFYTDNVQATFGLSLSVAQGERVALIGPNGAGKTSLLLAILAGVHFHGRIVVDGLELTLRSANQVRRRCGMTFQDSDDQLFMPTLLEDVAFGPLNHGLDAKAAQAVARKAIAEVNLAGLEQRPPHHLSGGQKREAALATVLAMEVQLLLLDEPGNNLDFRSRRRLIELLAGRPEAMLLATHDLDMAAGLCTRAVLIEAGRIVADGSVGEILGDKSLLAKHGVG